MAWANRVNTVSKQRVALFFCVRRILPALFFFGKGACGHSLFGRCLTITELMINEQIRDKEIRLIDENGEQLGIVSSREAQKIADERKLDLVKIAPTAKPPVCRIMDYGKYKFDQAKKEKEARKKQKTVDVKEHALSIPHKLVFLNQLIYRLSSLSDEKSKRIFEGRRQGENQHPFQRTRNRSFQGWHADHGGFCKGNRGIRHGG